MLSDEEKEAIDNMKSLLLYSKEHEYFSPFQEQEIDDMNIVLNIVEKQSKEIEELKNKNKKLQDKCKELIFEKQELTSALLDSTPNDKIKAKIEELEKLDFGTDLVSQFTANLTTITILQSLLEKE